MCHPGNCHSTWNGNRIANEVCIQSNMDACFLCHNISPPPSFQNGILSYASYYVYNENLSRDQPILFHYPGQRISKFEAFIGPT